MKYPKFAFIILFPVIALQLGACASSDEVASDGTSAAAVTSASNNDEVLSSLLMRQVLDRKLLGNDEGAVALDYFILTSALEGAGDTDLGAAVGATRCASVTGPHACTVAIKAGSPNGGTWSSYQLNARVENGTVVSASMESAPR